jgi:hypothetical protein
MKRAWITIAVVGALALPSWGQIRGVPASVTSFGPGRGANPGPAASVTSLGPRGFSRNFSTPCLNPLIAGGPGCGPTSRNFFPDGRHHRPGDLQQHRGFVPLYVPYAYPVAVAAEPEPQPEEVVEDDPPAPTIFEHRRTSERAYSAPVSRTRPEPEDAPAAKTREPEVRQPSPAEAREQIPVVLVYRDGHQQEVSNYAIVGQTLYSIGTFAAHKIPLADLNLKATIKANDDRGVEFAVPASVTLD